MQARILTRRVVATVAIAVTAGTASVAGVSLAQGNSTSPPPGAPGSPPAGILVAIHSALENLVAQGVIDPQQANAVQQQANSGSIDPKTLVQSGAVSDAQMRVIATSIDRVKEAAG